MPIGDGILGDWLYGDQGGLTPSPVSAPATYYLVDLELSTGTEYISTDNLNDVTIGAETRQYKRRLLDISSIVESLPSNDYGVSQLPPINVKLANNKGFFSALYNASTSKWRKEVVRIRRWNGSQVTGSWRTVIADVNMVDDATVSVRFYDPAELQILIPRRTVSTEDWVPKSTVAATAGGSLAAGTYYYTVLAYSSDGSILGKAEEISIALSGAYGTATISWTAVDGASYYRVFGYSSATASQYWQIAAGTETYADDGTSGTAGVAPTVIRPSVDLGKAYAIGIGENATDVPLRCINEDFTSDRYDYLCYGASAGGAITVHAVKRNGLAVAATEYTVVASSPYAGFLLIRFNAQQIDFSGNYHEITIDMSRTVQTADTFNFIPNIALLLSHATIGGGKAINADNFGVAATIARVASLSCSAVIDTQRPLQSIIDGMLWCVGGFIDMNADGEYEISIDQAVSGVSMSFDVKGEENRHRIFDMKERKRTSLSNAINTFVLEYRKQRTWSAGGGSTESYLLKTSSRTVHGFGKDEVHQTDYVRDKTVADRIACFWALKWAIGDESIVLECDKYATTLKRYQTIQFVDGVHGINDTYQVKEIGGELDKAELKCSHYDDSIYIYTAGTLPADPA